MAHALVLTDSSTIMHYLKRMGGTRSRSLELKVLEIIQWCQLSRVTLLAFHISGRNGPSAPESYSV